jgi:hypothetical protein
MNAQHLNIEEGKIMEYIALSDLHVGYRFSDMRINGLMYEWVDLDDDGWFVVVEGLKKHLTTDDVIEV